MFTWLGAKLGEMCDNRFFTEYSMGIFFGGSFGFLLDVLCLSFIVWYIRGLL